jgi:hypothetical protein
MTVMFVAVTATANLKARLSELERLRGQVAKSNRWPRGILDPQYQIKGWRGPEACANFGENEPQ